MPELPEVETVRRGLETLALGQQIQEAAVYAPRMLRHQNGGVPAFLEATRAFEITQVARHGKFLWLQSRKDQTIVIHLGMSGQLRPLEEVDSAALKHERVRLTFTEGTQTTEAPNHGVRFIDQRMFGATHTSPIIELFAPTLKDGAPPLRIPAAAAHIGVDLFHPELDLRKAAQLIRRSKSTIKSVLLNQQIVSGFGNIYADEALARTRIHGLRRASSLKLAQVVEILEQGREIMNLSLAHGGTSFDALYVDVNGKFGDFGEHLLVYGRKGAECRKCGRKIESLMSAGRSHHFCRHCQKPPRGV
ncbi:bifunctional DNA-formamidopyrimidine glycosylase/DNA-(apurinic or apyrimidinic site) lyase [Boudabousia marimammalium]|uniref:DNA-formamidopyrimidine glycosylase n=1 Tax=Boudabousia marimammalium TaxID=156892 RepID=A0A1Q5PRC6_9ACTO|nr:bifunctional DNA-formamidopyrimidine glycosylase/DNA-(apurinic or apyrimidinic site) lyase [Boudabousia marimammalium]OKL50117.1 DNA-formamidopyrimidine glycosylase [Boudabousia marimammalium]